jgi:DNA-binding XRE family transcriptional regulator
MHPKFKGMETKTRVGSWLYINMTARNFDCAEVARMLRVTRQAVWGHVSGNYLPNYPFVIAYCSILGGNPEEIWKLVELDREES